MMKFCTTLVLLALSTVTVLSQNVSIFRFEGDEFTDVSGTTLELDFECEQHLDFEVRLDEDETPFEFSIERIILEETEGTLEKYMFVKSVGFDDDAGYAGGTMEGVSPFVAPIFMTITHTEFTGFAAAGFSLGYECSGYSSCVDYMYYVINEEYERIDSVRIKSCAIAEVEDEEKWGKLTVAPNPSTDFINVEVSENMESDYYLSLVDITGKIVWKSERKSESSTKVDLRMFKAGVYFLNVFSVKENKVAKTVKVHKVS